MRLLALAIGLTLLVTPAGAKEYVYVRASDAPRGVCGSAASGWMQPGFDDSDWGSRTSVPDGGSGCAGTLFARWRFDLGPEASKLATVTLRIRYTHGFAAYLNGAEIARRRLEPNADSAAVAN